MERWRRAVNICPSSLTPLVISVNRKRVAGVREAGNRVSLASLDGPTVTMGQVVGASGEVREGEG